MIYNESAARAVRKGDLRKMDIERANVKNALRAGKKSSGLNQMIDNSSVILARTSEKLSKREWVLELSVSERDRWIGNIVCQGKRNRLAREERRIPLRVSEHASNRVIQWGGHRRILSALKQVGDAFLYVACGYLELLRATELEKGVLVGYDGGAFVVMAHQMPLDRRDPRTGLCERTYLPLAMATTALRDRDRWGDMSVGEAKRVLPDGVDADDMLEAFVEVLTAREALVN